MRGVALRLHGSLLVALPVFAWLAERELGGPVMLASIEGRARLSSWAWAGALTVALVLAVFVHAAAHLLAARACGARVSGVTLRLLGGCPRPHGATRAASIGVALAGPAASLLGAALAWALLRLRPPAAPDAQRALLLVAQAQLALGALDLLPSPSLDGGRVLVALLGRRRGGPPRALLHARRLGFLAAIGCAAAGTAWASGLLFALAALLWAGADEAGRPEVIALRRLVRVDGAHAGMGKAESACILVASEEPACRVASPSSSPPSPPRSPSPPAPTTTSTTTAPPAT